MCKILALILFLVVTASAQTPALTGVWKADLSKSKLPGNGPPPANYLILIEQKTAIFNARTKEEAPQIIETTGTWSQRGEQRSVLTVFNNDKPSVRLYQGVPTRLTANTQGSILTVVGEISGRSASFTRVYKISPDGQTLNVDLTSVSDGKEAITNLVLMKQPDAVGDILRKPEELAGVHFKNVKTDSLKTLPQSEFIDQMHYFSWSLNRNCEFCHVARKFDADDKKQKQTARKMIDMVAAIDHNHFEEHPEVRCFTCHEGHAHPLSHPQFPEEAAGEKAAIEKAAAEQRQAAPPPPSH